MSQKAIAFISYGLSPGGSERVITTLANSFCMTYEVFLVTLVDCESFYPLDPRIKHLSCDLHTDSKSIGVNRIYEYFKTIKRLTNIFKDNEIELVISFFTTVNVMSIIASKWSSIPCIVSERNNPVANAPSFFWKALRNLTYKFTDSLIVQTLANANYFQEIMPVKKIKVVPNPLAGILTDKRKLVANSEREKIILNVGRLDSNKSQDLLLRAFANVSNDDWRIQLVGDGDQFENYRGLTQVLGIEKKVEFLGTKKNIWDFYNKSMIFVFTSKSEGFPNALIEALYFGLPSISTNCPHGPSELINNGINGYLIPVDDQKQLEDKLSLLMNDETIRSKFSIQALIDSKAYKIDNIQQLWMSHIKALLDDQL
jgi:GalNAc-alpha-(1->4)-GalNAc-alpha-(1->3)-diNAcBac-PP-undecaprenol alpha-1,4-N-acetyl-D-galactosaminyltransferase